MLCPSYSTAQRVPSPRRPLSGLRRAVRDISAPSRANSTAAAFSLNCCVCCAGLYGRLRLSLGFVRSWCASRVLGGSATPGALSGCPGTRCAAAGFVLAFIVAGRGSALVASWAMFRRSTYKIGYKLCHR